MSKVTKKYVSIAIPTTPSISSFLSKYHSKPMICDYSNSLAITLLSITTYRNKKKDIELDLKKYSSKIILLINPNDVARRGCKNIRRMAVIAAYHHVKRLLYKELEKEVAIKTVRYMGKKQFSVRETIEWFQDEYGLCTEEFNYLRLHQHITRSRRLKK